jgi:hypothetical protein
MHTDWTPLEMLEQMLVVIYRNRYRDTDNEPGLLVRGAGLPPAASVPLLDEQMARETGTLRSFLCL